MTPALASLLSELDIHTVGPRGYCGEMGTMAVESMERILAQHGYAHLKLVLMSIAETANNKRALVAPVIWAISDLARAHPSWSERAMDWFAAFDQVNLGGLSAMAKINKRSIPQRAAIATLLFVHLQSVLGEPVSERGVA